MKPSRQRNRNDSGAATVFAAFLVAALAAAAIGGVGLGAVVVARHRAQAAADLAALAAAGQVPTGSQLACLEARVLVAAMHGALRDCEVMRLDVVVTVTVATGSRFIGDAWAVARAGPADGL